MNYDQLKGILEYVSDESEEDYKRRKRNRNKVKDETDVIPVKSEEPTKKRQRKAEEK